MKAIVCDVRRALAGRWFWAALLATTAALYLSIGQAADALMDDTQNLRFTLSELLLMALYGDFGMLTLPALSALPFAAQALHEIKCGAVCPAVFRAGRRMWILGKAAGCILSGMVLQAAAAGLLGLILYAVRGGGILLEINAEFNAALLRRMLCGGIWAERRMRDGAGNGNILRRAPRPAVPVLRADDARQALFPSGGDAKSYKLD
jgi:hypothetical protein